MQQQAQARNALIQQQQQFQQQQQPQQQQQLFQAQLQVKEESMDSTSSLTKLELADFDQDFNVFTNVSSKDVSLGGPYGGGKPQAAAQMVS